MLKTRTWALLIAAVASVRLLTMPSSGVVAVISQDGAMLREIDFSRVESTYRFTVETAGGGSKLLALLLALVMTLGLTTVGANAATYSDADSINYKLRMSFA